MKARLLLFLTLTTAFVVLPSMVSGQGKIMIDWQDRLPVSLNGELSSELPEGFEKLHWHSIRQEITSRAGYPDLNKIGPLFASDEAESLKKAIVEIDLESMKEHIQAGVDINEVGKGGMTPLFVALFQDADPRPFELLLDSGADLTPRLKSGPQVPTSMQLLSVPDLCGFTKYNRLFKRVFEQPSIDLKQRAPTWAALQGTTFSIAINGPFAPDLSERFDLLAKNGFKGKSAEGSSRWLQAWVTNAICMADEKQSETYAKMACKAISHGADVSVWFRRGNLLGRGKFHQYRVIHLLAIASRDNPARFKNEELQKVVGLIEKVNSLEDAKQDLIRWKKWSDMEMAGMVDLEYRKRRDDSTGDLTKQWIESDFESKLTELKKKSNIDVDGWPPTRKPLVKNVPASEI